MNRLSRILLVVVIVSLVSAAPSLAAAKRIGIDQRFGSDGWVKIPPAPNKRSSNTESTCSAGRGGQALVAARYDTGRNRAKPNASLLLNLNARGRRVRSFGNNGVLRFGPNETPTEIEGTSGNKWLVTFSDRTRSSWKLVRLLRSGARDKSFSGDGVLEVPGTTEGADFHQLENGGFVTYAAGGATIFDTNGLPRQAINGSGKLTVPFTISSVFETVDRKLLVLGRSGEQHVVTLLESDGLQSAFWNGGAPLTISPPPEASWKPVLQRKSDPPKDFTPRDPWMYAVRQVPGAVELVYMFEAVADPSGNYDEMVAMRLHLLPTGQLDARLRGTGWAFQQSDDLDELLGFYDDEVIKDWFYLQDGRKVHTEFRYGSEHFPGSWATFRVSDKRGRLSTRSARRITVNKLRFDDYDFDSAGKNLVVCGTRSFSKVVVGKVKL